MAVSKFLVTMLVEISIDDRLIADVLTDDWRSNFYPLRTRADVAEHLAFNIAQGRDLRSLDGFADQPDEYVPMSEFDVEVEEGETVEIVEDGIASRVVEGISRSARPSVADGRRGKVKRNSAKLPARTRRWT